jgi:hypothetical protein
MKTLKSYYFNPLFLKTAEVSKEFMDNKVSNEKYSICRSKTQNNNQYFNPKHID